VFTISLRPSTIYRAAGFFSLYVVSVLVSYFSFTLSRVVVREPVSPVPEERAGMFDLSPIPTPASPTAYHILLLGYGGEGHSGGRLSDSLTVVRVEPEKKRVVLVSVPRDLWVADTKINFAYSKGIEVAKNAVASVTGIAPTYFIAVDFNQFQKIIDLVGGIEVNVPKTFDDYFYPVRGKELDLCGKSPEEMQEVHQKYSGFELEKQFECRYEHIHYDKGLAKMTGEEAIKFVRSRHSNESGGDFARSERQFTVLKGLKDKLVSLKVIPKGGKIVDRISALAKTDLTPQKVSELLGLVGNPSEYTLKEIHLTEDNVLKSGTGAGGQFILLPRAGNNNFTEIRKFIQDQI